MTFGFGEGKGKFFLLMKIYTLFILKGVLGAGFVPLFSAFAKIKN